MVADQQDSFVSTNFAEGFAGYDVMNRSYIYVSYTLTVGK